MQSGPGAGRAGRRADPESPKPGISVHLHPCFARIFRFSVHFGERRPRPVWKTPVRGLPIGKLANRNPSFSCAAEGEVHVFSRFRRIQGCDARSPRVRTARPRRGARSPPPAIPGFHVTDARTSWRRPLPMGLGLIRSDSDSHVTLPMTTFESVAMEDIPCDKGSPIR